MCTSNTSIGLDFSESVLDYTIDNLIPGQPYYVRIKICRDVDTSASTLEMCSPFTYYGFPAAPVSVTPASAPTL